MSFATGLPPIDQAQLPADVRTAAPARKQAYEAGLGFERLLVQQLTQSLADSARDAMGGDSPYASLLPDALTDGVMSAGGLGLARQLTDAIAPASVLPQGPDTTTGQDASHASAVAAPTVAPTP